MTTPCSPHRARTSPLRRWTGAPAPDMRVSDTERNEVADKLSKHYGEGRLNDTEFGERLDQAMAAKTQSDLHGLLADLPGDGPPRGHQRPRAQRPGWGRIILLALLVVIAVSIAQAFVHLYFFWILLALAVFLLLRRGPLRR